MVEMMVVEAWQKKGWDSGEDTGVVVRHAYLWWDMAVVRHSDIWTSRAKKVFDGHWGSSSHQGVQCESLSRLASGMTVVLGADRSFHSTLPSLQWPHNFKDAPLFVQKHNSPEIVTIVCFWDSSLLRIDSKYNQNN